MDLEKSFVIPDSSIYIYIYIYIEKIFSKISKIIFHIDYRMSIVFVDFGFLGNLYFSSIWFYIYASYFESNNRCLLNPYVSSIDGNKPMLLEFYDSSLVASTHFFSLFGG